MIQGKILGTGRCLPQRILTNADLERRVDTSDEWITTRTGIRRRHIAGRGETTSRLAAEAGRRALAMAGVAPEELGLIIVGTISSEIAMPSCACLVQRELGASHAFAFDINAACCGFTYSLDIADRYVRTDPAMKILVIGAETLSTRTNWQDRNTCVLFGDGAGACLVGATTDGSGVVASRLHADGNLWQLLYMEGAPSMNPELVREDNPGPFIQMAGRDVFRHAVRSMGDVVGEVLAAAGVTADDLALVIPHQANIRIIQALAERLDLPMDKVYVNLQEYGNTSAASVPIALDEANRAGRLRPGDLVLLCTFGAGLTWGAVLYRW